MEINDYKIKLKLFIPAGMATVAPPLGPILSQYGINTIQFCKEFNEKTIEFVIFLNKENFKEVNFLLNVNIYIYEDKTFKFFINKPSIFFLIKIFLNIKKSYPNKLLKSLKLYDLILLAKFKFPFLNLFSACMLVRGVSRSLGIKIIK